MSPKADTPAKLEGGPEPVPVIIARDTAAEHARQFDADMKFLKDHPPDECKRPGGYFPNSDGTGAHDSEGNPAPVMPEDVEAVAQLRANAERRHIAAPVAEESAGDEPNG